MLESALFIPSCVYQKSFSVSRSKALEYSWLSSPQFRMGKPAHRVDLGIRSKDQSDR